MADQAHALHAVRAAVRLRETARSVDRARQQRGQAPFTIGIGVNTGEAVAGNMGSARRLNYTVLGASVNAANRLCAEAGADEVLIGQVTHEAVAAHVIATQQPSRVSKGFSVAVTPYLVVGLVEPAAGTQS
jgi:class 3 adenylate cyclase